MKRHRLSLLPGPERMGRQPVRWVVFLVEIEHFLGNYLGVSETASDVWGGDE